MGSGLNEAEPEPKALSSPDEGLGLARLSRAWYPGFIRRSAIALRRLRTLLQCPQCASVPPVRVPTAPSQCLRRAMALSAARPLPSSLPTTHAQDAGVSLRIYSICYVRQLYAVKPRQNTFGSKEHRSHGASSIQPSPRASQDVSTERRHSGALYLTGMEEYTYR